MRFCWFVALLFGCGVSSGDQCLIDSDCEPGLLCSFGGQCATPQEAARPRQPADAKDSDEPPVCDEVAGIFDKGEAPCADAKSVYAVSSIVIVDDQDHGLKILAFMGNGVLSDGIADGDIVIDAHLDGTLAAACDWSVAWMTVPADRNADCTAKYSDSFPFMLPAFSSRPILTVILDASYDPTSGILSGLVDKSDLDEGLKDDDIIQGVLDLLNEDVDTDNDGVPDKISVLLKVGLSLKSGNG